MKVAILGAESTGKTQLAQALAAHLRAHGQAVVQISEYLREWCEREGRTPRVDEQAAIAAEQQRRVEAAHAGSEQGAQPWVIADTTPLMTAVYSEMVFGDTSLYAHALQHQRGYHATLVTGLDLPWVADGIQRDGPHVREPVDALIRQALADAGLPFHVVYGSGQQRLWNALAALESATISESYGAIFTRDDALKNTEYLAKMGSSRRWQCESCADPDCERRLFRSLLK